MGMKNFFRRDRAVEADIEERGEVVFGSGYEGLISILGATGTSEAVTFREAISLPPVFAAINFLSSSLAGLPVKVYKRNAPGTPDEEVDHPVLALLNRAANDDQTAIDVREAVHAEQFGPGRGYLYIERDGSGLPINLFPLEFDRTTVRRTGQGRVFYDYARTDGTVVTYAGRDVVDLAFARCADMISSRSPVMTCAGALRQGLNASRYALTTFGRNGIPPYTLEGPMPTGDAARRAADDVSKVARRQADDGKPILPIPAGFKLTRLGDDPSKMQLTEVQIFTVQQVARIYGLPPVFLQELSTGTFANVEQQDLHLVKHSLAKRTKQSDAQYSLKLFGRESDLYVRTDLDEIAKGVFKDRIEAIARAIQTGQMTPNEGRELSGRGKLEGGDELFIQSATLPIRLIEEKLRADIARGDTKLPASAPANPKEENEA